MHKLLIGPPCGPIAIVSTQSPRGHELQALVFPSFGGERSGQVPARWVLARALFLPGQIPASRWVLTGWRAGEVVRVL